MWHTNIAHCILIALHSIAFSKIIARSEWCSYERNTFLIVYEKKINEKKKYKIKKLIFDRVNKSKSNEERKEMEERKKDRKKEKMIDELNFI